MPITGHKKIIDSLEKAYARKNVAHAYLFCGPEAVGKFLVAFEFASKLTGGKKQGLDQNLLVIAPEVEEKAGVFKEKDIRIDEIKKLQKEFGLTSFGENHRVVIIRSAQKLNVSAQNALLKILEEPPENSVLILLAENEKKLLPTIISRCQLVRFNLLSAQELSGLLDAGTKNRKEIIFWSLGRPGFVQNFLKNEAELEDRLELAREFDALFLMELNEKLFLAEKMSKDTPILLQKMDYWMIILRQAVLGNRGPVSLSPDVALRLIGDIEESKKIITTTNSNVRLALENLMLQF